MRAMILAAGLGERLRPITLSTPKPLIEIGGITMLERVINHLKTAGVFEIIINVHHLSEKIIDFLEKKRNFGIDIEISREEVLLDTGGGLKKASWFFKKEEPFFLYNCDIYTDFDLNLMKSQFNKDKVLSVLAVKKRPASRKFIFDEKNFLCGWVNENSGEKILKRSAKIENKFPFCGIHLISPEIFDFFPEKDIFSMTDFYLDLAEKNKNITFFEYTGEWYDIGKMDSLKILRAK